MSTILAENKKAASIILFTFSMTLSLLVLRSNSLKSKSKSSFNGIIKKLFHNILSKSVFPNKYDIFRNLNSITKGEG